MPSIESAGPLHTSIYLAIDLSPSAAAPIALLLITPLLLFGADLLFDEVLLVRNELRRAPHYRALIYLAVIAIALVVLLPVIGKGSYLEVFKVTASRLLWIMVAVLIGMFLAKYYLKKAWESARRRSIESLELELPQYLEMFHILITSGMSVLSALKVLAQAREGSSTTSLRVPHQPPLASKTLNLNVGISAKQRIGRPAPHRSLMREAIAQVLRLVEAGKSIELALDEVVMSIGSEQLRRFSDAVILGVERGSSMGQSLRNLIGETRNQSKIRIMQRAGKAEIQLLVPVVFLILPISVMFAVWPSYVNLVSIMG